MKNWKLKRTQRECRAAFQQMQSTQQPQEVTGRVPTRWRYVSPPWSCNRPLECSTAPSDRDGEDPSRSLSTSANCFEAICTNRNLICVCFVCFSPIIFKTACTHCRTFVCCVSQIVLFFFRFVWLICYERHLFLLGTVDAYKRFLCITLTCTEHSTDTLHATESYLSCFCLINHEGCTVVDR